MYSLARVFQELGESWAFRNGRVHPFQGVLRFLRHVFTRLFDGVSATLGSICRT